MSTLRLHQHLRLNAVAVLMPALAACGGGSAGTASAAANCIADAAEAPCQLLDEATLRAALPGLPDTVNQEQATLGRQLECRYSWSGGRQQSVQIGAMSMEVETDDQVTLSNIRPLEVDDPVQTFRFSHRTPDAEQQAQMNAMARERADEALKDKQLSDGAAEAVRSAAGSMASKIQWESIEGLGDAAAWGGLGRFKLLEVLVGNTTFSIDAQVANAETDRRDAAVAVARAIVARCD